MKFLFFTLMIITATLSTAQNKNIIYYEAKKIIKENVENFGFMGMDSIHKSVVLGIDVKIAVDTMFKSYKMYFTDKDYKSVEISFEYKRDYFPDKNGKNPDSDKIYLMELGGQYFRLFDLMDIYGINCLDITSEKVYSDNCRVVFRVLEVKRVSKFSP